MEQRRPLGQTMPERPDMPTMYLDTELPVDKINSKMDHRPRKMRNYKTPRREERTSGDLGFGSDSLDVTPKAQSRGHWTSGVFNKRTGVTLVSEISQASSGPLWDTGPARPPHRVESSAGPMRLAPLAPLPSPPSLW